MTLEEHISGLQNMVAELAQTQVDDNLLSTLDMIALIKLRWAEQGTRADGSNFSDYSDPYAKKREKKGLQTSHKDFNVTGELYRSIRPEIKSSGFGIVGIDITVRGNENQLKVIGQIKKDGVIIQPSPNTIQETIISNSRRRRNRAKKLLNA